MQGDERVRRPGERVRGRGPVVRGDRYGGLERPRRGADERHDLEVPHDLGLVVDIGDEAVEGWASAARSPAVTRAPRRRRNGFDHRPTRCGCSARSNRWSRIRARRRRARRSPRTRPGSARARPATAQRSRHGPPGPATPRARNSRCRGAPTRTISARGYASCRAGGLNTRSPSPPARSTATRSTPGIAAPIASAQRRSDGRPGWAGPIGSFEAQLATATLPRLRAGRGAFGVTSFARNCPV